MKQLDLTIILAAGEGTRMKSKTPKVLHEIAGRPLIEHVLYATAPLNAKEVRLVVGRSEERRVGKECSEPCRSRWSPYH